MGTGLHITGFCIIMSKGSLLFTDSLPDLREIRDDAFQGSIL